MAITLKAQSRAATGKGAARSVRREGRVPAIVYGHGDENRPLTVDALELQKLIASVNVENTLIDLDIDDGTAAPVLIREIQYHPTRMDVLHLDLYRIHAGEKIHLDVPVRLHGTPLGVREDGGILQETLRELRVECLPRNIPEGVDIDVSEMRIGDTVHVRDVKLPDTLILNDDDLVICSVSPPSVAVTTTPEEAEGVEAPEVVGTTEAEGEE